MGLVYLKDKPEAESFSYAYVEDADGKTVRVSIENMKSVLGIVDPIDTEITLTVDGWVQSTDQSYYTQAVTIEGSTANSRVELQPTPEQIIQLMNEELSMFIGNDEGTINAYSVNGYPSTDMKFKVRVTEAV